MSHPASYGGQAVLEGVMIRGPRSMAIACRRPSGAIVVRAQLLHGVHTSRFNRLPLVRGVMALAETLTLGMRALKFSSAVAMAEGDDETEFPDGVFWGWLVVALGFVGALFFASPLLLAGLLEGLHAGRVTAVLVEGVVRMAMFTGYIALVGLLPGIRRVFQYHGAEHMTIHADEAGAALTVEGVRPFPKEHRRCGTSFLFVMAMAAFLTFFLFDVFVDQGLLVRVASRVLLIPVIAALSYEVLRLGARSGERGPMRILFLPNIALQALTTRVPDDPQIEVALASFHAAVAAAAPVMVAAAIEPQYALAAD